MVEYKEEFINSLGLNNTAELIEEDLTNYIIQLSLPVLAHNALMNLLEIYREEVFIGAFLDGAITKPRVDELIHDSNGITKLIHNPQGKPIAYYI